MKNPIRDWFEQHDGNDADFTIAPRAYPFTVVPPTDATGTVLYSTKPHPILKLLHELSIEELSIEELSIEELSIEELGNEPHFAAVLSCGLPSVSEAK
jgi:hypothetical protein